METTLLSPAVQTASLRPRTRLDAAVVVLASRPRSLRRCLRSLHAAAAPRPARVVIVVNGRQTECLREAHAFRYTFGDVSILKTAPLYPGAARNLALKHLRSAWIVFLDDDVQVAPDFFGILSAKIARFPGAAVIGGPNPPPPDSNLFQRACAWALATRWAAGPFWRRTYGYPRDSWTDDRGLILCNLAFNRFLLTAERLTFPEDLERNEENLLAQRLLERGHRLLHAPELVVFHDRRKTLRGFLRQCFLSGVGRTRMSVAFPKSLRVPGPTLLIAALGAASTLFFANPGAVFAGFYGGLLLAHGTAVLKRGGENLSTAGLSILLVPLAHLGYGFGLLRGLFGNRHASS